MVGKPRVVLVCLWPVVAWDTAFRCWTDSFVPTGSRVAVAGRQDHMYVVLENESGIEPELRSMPHAWRVP